jgi:hypothetical protein
VVVREGNRRTDRRVKAGICPVIPKELCERCPESGVCVANDLRGGTIPSQSKTGIRLTAVRTLKPTGGKT